MEGFIGNELENSKENTPPSKVLTLFLMGPIVTWFKTQKEQTAR